MKIKYEDFINLDKDWRTRKVLTRTQKKVKNQFSELVLQNPFTIQEIIEKKLKQIQYNSRVSIKSLFLEGKKTCTHKRTKINFPSHYLVNLDLDLFGEKFDLKFKIAPSYNYDHDLDIQYLNNCTPWICDEDLSKLFDNFFEKEFLDTVGLSYLKNGKKRGVGIEENVFKFSEWNSYDHAENIMKKVDIMNEIFKEKNVYFFKSCFEDSFFKMRPKCMNTGLLCYLQSLADKNLETKLRIYLPIKNSTLEDHMELTGLKKVFNLTHYFDDGISRIYAKSQL